MPIIGKSNVALGSEVKFPKSRASDGYLSVCDSLREFSEEKGNESSSGGRRSN